MKERIKFEEELKAVRIKIDRFEKSGKDLEFISEYHLLLKESNILIYNIGLYC